MAVDYALRRDVAIARSRHVAELSQFKFRLRCREAVRGAQPDALGVTERF